MKFIGCLLPFKISTPFLLLIFFLSSMGCVCCHALDSTEKFPWTLNEEYQGPYQKSFQKMRYEIPIFMRQTLIDLSVKLGLRFEEGWNFPLVIGFVDHSPTGVENVLAYVQLGQSQGQFFQVLNMNLAAYEADQFNYKKVFTHELVHAMLNDALGGQAAMKIPVWLHEGLAVYGADQGKKMLENYVYATNGFSESQLLNGLEVHEGALDYAEDYLAIQYLAVKKGPNCLANFVRETIKREGDYKAALSYTCFESWDEFQLNVKKFSKEEIQNIGPAHFRYQGKPY